MKSIYIFFLLAITSSVIAQKNELGKVTVDELKQNHHPIEKEAPAAVLFEKGTTRLEYRQTDGFYLNSDIEVKIKIYTKDGLDYANKKIDFYTQSPLKETVSFSKAYTYNLVDGKIDKTKLKSEGEFVDELNKYWSEKRIAMPNAREGSIIEYKINIKSPILERVPDWEFQKSIPVDFSEFVLITPEFYNYKPIFKGYITPKIVTTTRNLSLQLSERQRADFYSFKSSMNYDGIDYLETTNIFSLSNVPSLSDESFVANIDNYKAAVIHDLFSINMPNKVPKYLSTNWNDVARSIYVSDSFNEEIKKRSYFEKDIAPIIAESKSKQETMFKIFKFVQDRMTWNNLVGVYTNKGVRTAYKDKSGNAAEINLMLTAMLKEANINANPVLISTVSNGIPLFPSRKGLNFVVVLVEEAGESYLLDATNKFTSPNILPIRDLNWNGIVIYNNDHVSTVNLTPRKVSNTITNVLAKVETNGEVSGKYRGQMFDHHAFIFNENYLNLSAESNIKRLEKNLPNSEIDIYQTTPQTTQNTPVTEEYSFTKKGITESIGDKMYFSPLLDYGIQDNPFKLQQRDHPIEFVFPSSRKYNISITIPEGYEIESIPNSEIMLFDQEKIEYKYQISQRNNFIQVSVTFNTNETVISPDSYQDLKLFFENILKKTTEKVVLKKI